MEKTNNTRRAIITIIAGTLVSVVLPILLTQYSSGISFADTGQVGDTIGGIAGPVLNFTGLLIVYFSLQEQFKSNEMQTLHFQEEQKRTRNESAVSLAFKIIDDLRVEISNKEKQDGFTTAIEQGPVNLFTEFSEEVRYNWIMNLDDMHSIRNLPKVDVASAANEETDIFILEGNVRGYFNFLEKNLMPIISIFELLKYSIEESALPVRQRALLYNVVYSFYEPFICQCFFGLEIFSDTHLFSDTLVSTLHFLDKKLQEGLHELMTVSTSYS